jgi:hypothetical protein
MTKPTGNPKEHRFFVGYEKNNKTYLSAGKFSCFTTSIDVAEMYTLRGAKRALTRMQFYYVDKLFIYELGYPLLKKLED